MSELIYRVETPEKRGMYAVSGGLNTIHRKLYGESSDEDTQPSPNDDRVNDFNCRWWNTQFTRHDLRFGFTSKEQFVNWTMSDKCREMLHDVGLIVSVYEVEPMHTFCSDKQAVFNVEEATILEKMTIREFMEEVK